MRRFLFAPLAACLLLIPALQSAAQYEDKEPKLGFKVGIYYPSGTKFRNDSKDLWRSLGLEYSLKSDDLGRPTLVANALATSTDTGKIEASMIGFQAEKRWYMSQSENNSLYYGAGLGYYILEAQERDFEWLDWEKRSGGKLGMTAVAGYQFKQTAFAELRYNYSGELSNGLDFSGLNLNLGLRMSF